MKLGCQTIIYGRNIDNLDRVLANIANLGFAGVEFYQQPSRIWLYERGEFRRATIEDIILRLRQYGLTLLGFASGKLWERIAFCRLRDEEVRLRESISDEECTPLYQYAEDPKDHGAQSALSSGVKLAFHPHAFSRYERFEQLGAELDNPHPNLYWLPDTAHMVVVGEDPVEVLSRLALDKIIAVHLKAYNPAYGRAFYRYARGFVPLSEADGTVLRCIQTLEDRGFGSWYVVEQDSSHTDPITSLGKSADWLIEHGYMAAPETHFDLYHLGPESRPIHVPAELQAGLNSFISQIYSASDARLDACYTSIARQLMKLTSAEYVSLWSWSRSMMDIRLIAAYPAEMLSADNGGLLKIDSTALESIQYPMDVEEAGIGESDAAMNSLFSQYGGTAAFQTGFRFTFAVPNVYNPHSIRLLVSGVTASAAAYSYRDLVELIADDVSRAVNNALDGACSIAAAAVNLAADDHEDSPGFLASIAETVKHNIGCEGVSIFLENRGGERLEPRYSRELRWTQGLAENERCYRATEIIHPTVTCWQECRVVLTNSGPAMRPDGVLVQAKSREVVPQGSESHDDVLLVPFVAVNKQPDGSAVARAIGVIRCRNKQLVSASGAVKHRPYFTNDDAAIVSAACQAAVPHIDSLLRDEGMTDNVASMTHELNMPVNTLQAAVDRVQTLIARNDTSRLNDLAEDMISWTGLMGKIIGMVDLFGKRNKPLEPECSRIGLFGDVIAPLKPVMKKLLDNRKFSTEHIHYASFETLPLLYLDRNLFQMVFFNLFSNSIKYAFDDPSQFEVDIDAEYTDGEFRIHFSDYGPGIEESYASSVFEHGMRGPTSLNKVVKGMGLGLWVVKRVVEAHEGHVEITSFHRPTTITIYLPEARRSSPPPKARKG